MHVDLTTTTLSLAGLGGRRTFGLVSTDPGTVVQLFAGDAAGVAYSAGTPLLDDNNKPLVVRGVSASVRLTDGSTFVGYKLLAGAAPTAVWVDADATNITAAATLAVFGDGSDGTVVFDGSTTILGLVPSANVYTLTRDLFHQNGTVNAGVTLNAAGFKIFCAGAFTIAATGIVANNGNAGVIGTAGGAGAAGAISAAGSTAQGTAGGAGGAGNNAGAAGTANAIGFPGGTGIGGAGGGDGTHTAAAAGAWTALVATKGGARHALSLILGMSFGTSTISPFGGGSGGGGGGGDNADAGGGGGGGGGGVLIIAAMTLVNNGTVTATGGAGGAGFSTAHNAGGGGGGGGGTVITVARSSSGTGTVSAAGGAGGAKVGAAGVVGAAGAVGNVIQALA